MFINSSKCFEIHEGERNFAIPRNFIGEIPDWVASHWLVRSAIQDGSIATPQGTDDKSMEKADKVARKRAGEYKAMPDEGSIPKEGDAG